MRSKEVNQFDTDLVQSISKSSEFNDNFPFELEAAGPLCRVTKSLNDTLESFLLMQIIYCVLAIALYTGIKKHFDE